MCDIDYKKFIEDLIELNTFKIPDGRISRGWMSERLVKALNNQGFIVDQNGEIKKFVEIKEQKLEKSPFIEEGRWYMCTRDYDPFKKGEVHIATGPHQIAYVDFCHDFPEYYFRPATNDEVFNSALKDRKDSCSSGVAYSNKVESYIDSYTRNCSNEIGVDAAEEKPLYYPWLTPEHARSVALIAKEELAEKIDKWLYNYPNSSAPTVNVNNFRKAFRKFLEDENICIDKIS
jgi:hypothetical protein